MRIVLLNAFLFSVISTSLCQEGKEAPNDDVVYIKMLEESPDKLSMFVLQIPLWHLTGSKINSSLLDLKTNLAYVGGYGRFNGGLNYTYKLGGNVMPSSSEFSINYNERVMSVNEVSKPQNLEVYGTFFFNKKFEDTEERIRLKQVGNTAYVTDVKTKKYIKTGIFFGYEQGFTWYNMNKMKLNVTSIDDPSFSTEVSMNSMSTIQDYKYVKLGITRTKAVNFKIDAEGYGVKSTGWITMYNFNTIIALQNSFDDVFVGYPNTDNNTVEVARFSINDSNKKLPIGVEFSARHYNKKSFFEFEYGIRYLPGLLKNINLMVNFGVSFSIDFLRGNAL